MNVGILYICTGKYDQFFKEFYESCEANLLDGHRKTYYVWTDSSDPAFDKANVKKFYQEKLGWPYDTMLRFEMFSSQKEALSKEDCLFFFNANMIVNEKVGDEILPSDFEPFVGVLHPSFYNQTRHAFPYERDFSSTFVMTSFEGNNYFQGCLNGGLTEHYLAMSDYLTYAIRQEMAESRIPIWHDESAINWYFYHIRVPKKLSPAYAYPEGWDLPFDKKIIQLDKSLRGGHQQLRS